LLPHSQYESCQRLKETIGIISLQAIAATIAWEIDSNKDMGRESGGSKVVAPEEEGIGEAWYIINI
jgi:hypothetical protein